MSAFQADERGTGSARRHPRMMLALLACCYANGIFGSRRTGRAVAPRERLRGGTGDLLGEAERADVRDAPDPRSLPEEPERRETPAAKSDEACAGLERRARERAASERAERGRKAAARDKRRGRREGKRAKPPREGPRPEERASPADPGSALMRRNRRGGHRRRCSAQAVVDAGGSRLVLGSRAGPCAGDRGEPAADVDPAPGALGSPDRALADNGYATGTEVAEPGNRGLEVLVAVGTEGRRRARGFRPPAPERPAREPKAEWPGRMRARMATEESRARCRLRKQAVEPVFGIVKGAMGFRRFLLRGLGKAGTGWALAALACDCKRLSNLRLA